MNNSTNPMFCCALKSQAYFDSTSYRRRKERQRDINHAECNSVSTSNSSSSNFVRLTRFQISDIGTGRSQTRGLLLEDLTVVGEAPAWKSWRSVMSTMLNASLLAKFCIGLQYSLSETTEPAARALMCLDLGVRVLHLEEGSYTVPHPLQSSITWSLW
jgi:hypothetical protein